MISELRERLDAAGYTENGVRDALGASPGIGLAQAHEVYLRRLGDDSLGTLIKLFWLGASVEEREVRRILDLEDLVEAGLVELGDGQARSRWKIAVHDDVYLVSDFEQRRAEPDYVSGASLAARMLAALTLRPPARLTLDLGTGSGIQGLLAARHSEHVVGVDINERALQCAALNARLNGIGNFEARLGSWFEPVQEREFDLIVANPPYVVSPDRELAYRDSDLPRDEVSLMVLRGAAERLAEGGFAVVACNWVHAPDRDWREPLERAFAGSGCDAVLLRFEAFDGAGYAACWNAALVDDLTTFRATLDRWLDYFRREGIEQISAGTVVLRRRSGDRNWVRAFELPGLPGSGAGAHVERLFTGKDFLRSIGGDDDELLATAFALPDGAAFEHHYGPTRGEEGYTLVQAPGSVGFAARIEPDAARRLARCDGQRALRELGGDSEALAKAARRLLELGFLRKNGP